MISMESHLLAVQKMLLFAVYVKPLLADIVIMCAKCEYSESSVHMHLAVNYQPHSYMIMSRVL